MNRSTLTAWIIVISVVFGAVFLAGVKTSHLWAQGPATGGGAHRGPNPAHTHPATRSLQINGGVPADAQCNGTTKNTQDGRHGQIFGAADIDSCEYTYDFPSDYAAGTDVTFVLYFHATGNGAAGHEIDFDFVAYFGGSGDFSATACQTTLNSLFDASTVGINTMVVVSGTITNANCSFTAGGGRLAFSVERNGNTAADDYPSNIVLMAASIEYIAQSVETY